MSAIWSAMVKYGGAAVLSMAWRANLITGLPATVTPAKILRGGKVLPVLSAMLSIPYCVST